MTSIKILFYAEDPGAANFLDGMIALTIKSNMSVVLIAEGKAREKFEGRYELSSLPENYANAASVLELYNPNLVIVGTAVNPDTLGLGLISEAKNRGIKTIGVIDGPGNEAWRFRGQSKNPLEHAPDKILVPDIATAQAFINLGVAEKSVFPCGSPHNDFLHNSRAKLSRSDRQDLRIEIIPNAAIEQKIIICAPDPIGGVNPKEHVRSKDYTLHGTGVSNERPDIFIEEFLEGLSHCDGSKDYCILRLHPRSQSSDFKADLSRFDKISQGDNVLGLLYAADLVVGLTSILIVEAALLGTPTLSIIPRAKEASWLSTIGLGITPVATSQQEIRNLLPIQLNANRLSIDTIKSAFPENCAKRALEISLS